MSDQTLHDVANLLTSMLAATHDASLDIQRARESGAHDDDLNDHLQAAQESLFYLQHAGALIAHVMGSQRQLPHAGGGEGDPAVAPLGAALDLAIAAARPILAHRVELTVRSDRDLTVHGHPNDLAMVFFNLFINAYQAICKRPGDSGRIEVSVIERRKQIHIEIRDNGPGMTDVQLLKAFRAGYSSRGGLGLGLSICSQTVARYGGHMQIRSPEGLVVVVVLQRATSADAGAPEELDAIAG